MKKLSLLLIGLIGYIQFAVAAPTKAEADEAYQKEKFSEAASLYEEILQTQGESADIYYNLGNAYFKDGGQDYAYCRSVHRDVV